MDQVKMQTADDVQAQWELADEELDRAPAREGWRVSTRPGRQTNDDAPVRACGSYGR